MRRDLKTAMKARDQIAVASIRSALAAIDNAEAVQVEHGVTENGGANVAGSVVGLGAAEAERRDLAADDIHAIIEAEVHDRAVAAGRYEQVGRNDAAERLRAETDVLGRYLSPEQ